MGQNNCEKAVNSFFFLLRRMNAMNESAPKNAYLSRGAPHCRASKEFRDHLIDRVSCDISVSSYDCTLHLSRASFSSSSVHFGGHCGGAKSHVTFRARGPLCWRREQHLVSMEGIKRGNERKRGINCKSGRPPVPVTPEFKNQHKMCLDWQGPEDTPIVNTKRPR